MSGLDAVGLVNRPIELPRSVQEEAAAATLACSDSAAMSTRTIFTVDDPAEWVADHVRQATGRPVGALPVWVRAIRRDLDRGALFIVRDPCVGDEAVLTVLAEPGVISRAVLRSIAIWCFRIVGLKRLAVRIPACRADLQRLAERGGFVREGVARSGEPDGSDTVLIAMLPAECPWLPRHASSKGMH